MSPITLNVENVVDVVARLTHRGPDNVTGRIAAAVEPGRSYTARELAAILAASGRPVTGPKVHRAAYRLVERGVLAKRQVRRGSTTVNLYRRRA